jgi:uncharacterized membrane protein
MGFTLARLQYLSFNGIFCNPASTTGNAAPGECFWYSIPRYHIGIIIHLAAILPAAFLAVFQFVPAIRHKALIYHRIAGYIIILLVLVSTAAALMIADRAFGGSITTQTGFGLLAIAATFGICNAYYNIKRLQIDQHRAWMLRVWSWMASIISLRLIQKAAATIISMYPTRFYSVLPCAEILFIYESYTHSTKAAMGATYGLYPACAPSHANYTINGQVVVHANQNSGPEQVGVALDLTFPLSFWLALVIHAVGVELYLQLTPKETQRLRTVSYQKQLEAGMKNPGSAGLVPEKFGDMDSWQPTKVPEEEDNALIDNVETIEM